MKVIGAAEMDGLVLDAQGSARRRAHLTLHDSLDDPIQRVVIALEMGTYVRPHRHADNVWELFVVLDGILAVLLFDDDGRVSHRIELRPDSARLVQISPATWHSIVALAPATVALEVKPGPYRPATDKDFAAWAPPEGDSAAPNLVRWMAGAAIGERCSGS